MNAKEIFKELGFEYKKYGTDFAYEYEVERGIKFVHFDLSMHKYCTNIYHVNKRLHNAITMQMKELGWLDSELYEFNNHKAYTFEELKPDMWVWDDKLKWLYQIFATREEDKSIEVIVSDRNAIFRKVVTLGEFEENRFYPVQQMKVNSNEKSI